MTANYAVLDLASRYKDQFLYNIYKMGSNQIERGSPRSLDDLERRHGAPARRRWRAAAPAGGGAAGAAAVAAAAAPAAPRRRRRRRTPPQAGGGGAAAAAVCTMAQYNAVLKDPARRDPRVYVIPADQPDFPTATKFINTLRYVGVEVQQATAPLHRRRQDLSGRLLRREDGAGRTRPRDRHVRAAGSSERHGRARHSAPPVRQRRLDARRTRWA